MLLEPHFKLPPGLFRKQSDLAHGSAPSLLETQDVSCTYSHMSNLAKVHKEIQSAEKESTDDSNTQ